MEEIPMMPQKTKGKKHSCDVTESKKRDICNTTENKKRKSI
jgi:hypothetical protein